MSNRIQFTFSIAAARTLRVQTDVRIRDIRQQMEEHGWGLSSCTGQELRLLEQAARDLDHALDKFKEAA